MDKQGMITVSNLKRVLNHELDMNISDELLDVMISQCTFSQLKEGSSVNEAQYLKFIKKFKKLH